jgi:hypothetical protein
VLPGTKKEEKEEGGGEREEGTHQQWGMSVCHGRKKGKRNAHRKEKNRTVGRIVVLIQIGFVGIGIGCRQGWCFIGAIVTRGTFVQCHHCFKYFLRVPGT